MKIFITGASGFIGSLLSKRLIEENHDVAVLVRNMANAEEFIKSGIRVINGDIFDQEKLRRGMEGCDWVFHLAAYARPTSLDNSLFFKTNVQGTENILNAATKENVRRVIVTSTAGTMGYSTDGKPVSEESGVCPEYHTDYEKTKAQSEKIAFNSITDTTDVIVVNPSRVFGPGKISVSNAVTRIIKQYGNGVWRIIPGDGSSIGNYAFIDDVVNGHILAAMHGKSGERYILGGDNISFIRFFEVLGKVYGRKRKLIKLSAETMKSIAKLFGSFSSLSGKPPLISADWIDKYLQNWILSCEKAERDLFYRITPFEEAVEKTVSWLKINRKNGQ